MAAMDSPQAANNSKDALVGIGLTVGGGLLVALGTTTGWAKATVAMPGVGTEHYTVSGLDMAQGPVVLGLGIACVLAGVAFFALRRRPVALVAALAGIAAGGLSLVLGIMAAANLEDGAVDAIVAQAGVPLESFNDAAREILTSSMATGAGWGLYLSILGGMVAVLGGVLLVMSYRAERLSAPADDPVEQEAAADTPLA